MSADTTIAKVVTKVSLRDCHTDFAYWQTQSYQARLTALEQIRREYHGWEKGAQPKVEGVYRIVKREYRHLLLQTTLLTVICGLGVGSATAWPKHKPRPASQSETSPQRSDEKVVENEEYPGEPVEVESIAIKNVKVALNQKFSARALAKHGGGPEEDWLENLEVTIKNKSDKRITYLSISLGFPFAGSTNTSAGTFYGLTFGIDLRASGEAATYIEPFSLGAGESYTVRFSDKGLKEIKSRLAMVKSQLADMNRMILRIPTIGYEDGVQWQLGKYSVPEKQQQSERKAIEKAGYDIEPYEISDLSVNNVKITPRERLVSNGFMKVRRESYEFSVKAKALSSGGPEGEWLEGLEFSFTNRSTKRVTCIGLELGFPETEVNGPQMVYRFSRGNSWESAKDPSRLVEPLALESGEVVTLRLSDKHLKALTNFLALRKVHLAGLNRAVMKVIDIRYEDETRWSGGAYYRPNPDKPGAYYRIVQ